MRESRHARAFPPRFAAAYCHSSHCRSTLACSVLSATSQPRSAPSASALSVAAFATVIIFATASRTSRLRRVARRMRGSGGGFAMPVVRIVSLTMSWSDILCRSRRVPRLM